MNNTKQTHDQTFHPNLSVKINLFNTLLTKALQQKSPTLFSLSVGTLLEIQDLMFPISQTSPTEASTEFLSETSSNQTSKQNTTKEEKKSLIKRLFQQTLIKHSIQFTITKI